MQHALFDNCKAQPKLSKIGIWATFWMSTLTPIEFKGNRSSKNEGRIYFYTALTVPDVTLGSYGMSHWLLRTNPSPSHHPFLTVNADQ
jgi:hypothetical protein